MRELLLAAVFFAVAAPCAAQFKDAAAAKTALSSAKAKDRLDAISYFGSLRSEEGYKALAAHFPEEKDAYLRVQMVGALNVQSSTWAYNCVAAASDDSNKGVRQAAASALAPKVGDPYVAEKLKTLSLDPAESVRLSVVNALAVNPSTVSVAIIGGALADRKGSLRSRRAAAGALSKMNTPAADSELMKHLSDADPQIKAAAQSRRPSKKQKNK